MLNSFDTLSLCNIFYFFAHVGNIAKNINIESKVLEIRVYAIIILVLYRKLKNKGDFNNFVRLFYMAPIYKNIKFYEIVAVVANSRQSMRQSQLADGRGALLASVFCAAICFFSQESGDSRTVPTWGFLELTRDQASQPNFKLLTQDTDVDSREYVNFGVHTRKNRANTFALGRAKHTYLFVVPVKKVRMHECVWKKSWSVPRKKKWRKARVKEKDEKLKKEKI